MKNRKKRVICTGAVVIGATFEERKNDNLHSSMTPNAHDDPVELNVESQRIANSKLACITSDVAIFALARYWSRLYD